MYFASGTTTWNDHVSVGHRCKEGSASCLSSRRDPHDIYLTSNILTWFISIQLANGILTNTLVLIEMAANGGSEYVISIKIAVKDELMDKCHDNLTRVALCLD